jgi:hypothetical protein
MRGTHVLNIRQIDMLIGRDLEGGDRGLIYCGISRVLLWRITVKCFSQNCLWELVLMRQDW